MKKSSIIIVIIVVAIAAAAGIYFMRSSDTGKAYYYPTGDPFVTNVLGSDKLIKTAVVLELSADKVKELEESNAVVRDCILNVLRNQTEEQFERGDLQQLLSDAIVTQLNEIFPPQKGQDKLFVRAYFTDFVMQ